MRISKKGALAVLLVSITLASALTYALIITTVTVPSHLKILGGAMELWVWEEVNGTERYSLEYLSDDCGGLIGGESWESVLLVLAVGSDTSIDQVLSFNDTLPDNVGTVVWQIEVFIDSGWHWINWTESKIVVDHSTTPVSEIYLPGTHWNPIKPLQKIGLRPEYSELVMGSTGHFKYTIYTYETAPCADYDFDVTVVGTEYPF